VKPLSKDNVHEDLPTATESVSSLTQLTCIFSEVFSLVLVYFLSLLLSVSVVYYPLYIKFCSRTFRTRTCTGMQPVSNALTARRH